MNRRIVVTGGAGYLGSALVALLLEEGDHVTVVDDLWFGGEALLPFLHFKRFRFEKADICTSRTLGQVMQGAHGVVHLAALVGFPSCNRAGRAATWRVNVTGTQCVYEAAVRAGVGRFVFASSYSNYGHCDDESLVTEESPLFPQSTYAESKIAGERLLLEQATHNSLGPVCLRLATIFGLSPRMRFDLMVNQFALDAWLKGRLVLYQGDVKRSFLHVRDVARAVSCVLDATDEQVRGQVFNIGSEKLNTTKTFLVKLLRDHWPDVTVESRDVTLGGDMRSIHMSCEKARRVLGFEAAVTLEEGIAELCWALENKMIQEAHGARHRNHPAIVV